MFQVKFLMNKPGAAMVELSDHVACNTVIQCLRNQQLFGEQLEFRSVPALCAVWLFLVFIFISHWLLKLFYFLLISHCYYFGFGFTSPD